MDTTPVISWFARLDALFAAAVLVAAASSTRADETIDVALIDHGMESMKMELSTEQVRAGNVTFNVTNKSESLVHEFVVVSPGQPIELWPYNDSAKEVEEDALKVVNEIEDIDPGKSGTLAVMLEPGTYTLFCNIAGHFKAGMVHTLTVTQ